MNRIVRHARLHSSDTFINGIGNVGSVLPGSITDCHMVMTSDGLEVTVKKNKLTIECFIPSANVKIVEFAPQPTVTIKKS